MALLKAALEKFAPGSATQEAFRINDVARLRLPDLPATSKFMESFVGSKLPSQPLYDLPSWLEHSYPQYDTSPKSPFYSWVAWMRDNLPREQQRLLHAFNGYMQDDRYRRGITRQANFELARLWHWEHQRAAAGLPFQLTEEEQGAASASARQQAAERGSVAASPSHPAGANSSAAQPLEPGAQATLSAPAAPASVEPAAPPAPPPAPKAKAPSALGGILGIIQQADKKQKQAEEEAQEQLAAQGLRDLTPEQRALVSSLKLPDTELRSLARGFNERLLRGKELLAKTGPSRARDILQGELEARTAAVIEATNSGQDHTEIQSRTTLFNSSGDAVDGVAAAPALRKLHAGDLRQALEGYRHWTHSLLLDHRANQQQLEAQSDDVRRAVQELRDADERLLRQVQDHGYKFNLSIRPPTPVLDRLTEYLQVKYMDVLHQKDDVHAFLSRQDPEQQQQRFGALLSQPVAPAVWKGLSPQEVQQLNAQATAAFQDIGKGEGMTAYAELMRGMHRSGIIGKTELEESLAAARVKAAETKAATQQQAPTTPSPATIDSLLALLTGSPSPNASISSGGVSGAEVQARQLWDGAAKGSFAAWSSSMQQHIRDDIKTRRAQGEKLSDAQEQDLLAWWGQPVLFSEAQQAWAEYLGAAGMPHGPRLEDVLLCDQELRKARAPTAGNSQQEPGLGGGPAAQSQAASLAAQLKEAFEAFSARHGSTICSTSSSDGGSPPSTSASNATPSNNDVSWDEVQRRNLLLDVKSADALRSTFHAPSLQQVLSQHWEAVARRLLPNTPASSSGTSKAVSSFEGLWGLMLQVYDTTVAQAQQQQRIGAASQSSTLTSTSAPAGGPTTTAVPGPAKEQWQSYVQSRTQEAATLQAPPVSPPYPGAKPILNFRQTFVLAPTPSTSSTSVATSGFGPSSQPGSLDSHVNNRGVELRVRITDLQREAQLSDAAVRLIVDICGKQRYDERRKELVLQADTYPNREENRRLVLEQLHRLLEEAQNVADA